MATATQAGFRIASAIYNAMTPENTKIVPNPTNENVLDFMTAVVNYTPAYNEFMHLINKIALSRFNHMRTKNPLELVVKGALPHGYNIEDIFADQLDVEDWRACDDGTFEDLFGTAPSKVYGMYYSINFQKSVKRSIPDTVMARGFRDWSELNDAIGQMIDVMYESMKDMEAQTTEELLNHGHVSGVFYPVKVNAIDLNNLPDSDALHSQLEVNTIWSKAIVHRIGVRASRKYNFAGVATMTNIDNVLFILTPEYLAAQDVSILAASFHMEKAEFLGRVIEVSGYGGAENDGAVGFIVDEDWFQIWTVKRQMTEQYNSVSRTWNYRYFSDAIFAYSFFANAIELCSSLKTIKSVTVTAGQSAPKCQDTQIAYTVENNGEVGAWSAKCNWSIDGNTSKKTYISPFGLLHIGNDETASEINVTATSVMDATKTSTEAVTITG